MVTLPQIQDAFKRRLQPDKMVTVTGGSCSCEIRAFKYRRSGVRSICGRIVI